MSASCFLSAPSACVASTSAATARPNAGSSIAPSPSPVALRKPRRCTIRASAQVARGVDDVDAVEARRAGAMRDRRHLRGLALAVEERSAEAVVDLLAHGHARVPEFRGADLVGDVLDHAGDLAVLDLIEQLAAELRVVALLVD